MVVRLGQITADPHPDHPGACGVLRRDPAQSRAARTQAGKKKAEKYLLAVCTELYTHYLLGDRDLSTFKAFIFTDLINSVIVHHRYQNYDSVALWTLVPPAVLPSLCRPADYVDVEVVGASGWGCSGCGCRHNRRLSSKACP
ncbi:MAG: hypothetical protein ACRDRI_06705 [Pseudonocardiaceae bacterium]